MAYLKKISVSDNPCLKSLAVVTNNWLLVYWCILAPKKRYRLSTQVSENIAFMFNKTVTLHAGWGAEQKLRVNPPFTLFALLVVACQEWKLFSGKHVMHNTLLHHRRHLFRFLPYLGKKRVEVHYLHSLVVRSFDWVESRCAKRDSIVLCRNLARAFSL